MKGPLWVPRSSPAKGGAESSPVPGMRDGEEHNTLLPVALVLWTYALPCTHSVEMSVIRPLIGPMGD